MSKYPTLKQLADLPGFVFKHQVAKIRAGSNDPADDNYNSEHVKVDDLGEADIIISHEPETNLHRPVLDIDLPISVIPSSTPGHYHLYIDKPMSWSEYSYLLDALAEAGIIEQRYANVSLMRGCTAVRLPWVKKQIKEQQVQKQNKEIF